MSFEKLSPTFHDFLCYRPFYPIIFNNWGLLLVKYNGYSLFGLFAYLFFILVQMFFKDLAPLLLVKGGSSIVRRDFRIVVKDMDLPTL